MNSDKISTRLKQTWQAARKTANISKQIVIGAGVVTLASGTAAGSSSANQPAVHLDPKIVSERRVLSKLAGKFILKRSRGGRYSFAQHRSHSSHSSHSSHYSSSSSGHASHYSSSSTSSYPSYSYTPAATPTPTAATPNVTPSPKSNPVKQPKSSANSSNTNTSVSTTSSSSPTPAPVELVSNTDGANTNGKNQSFDWGWFGLLGLLGLFGLLPRKRTDKAQTGRSGHNSSFSRK